jgi:hypothetical protein
MTLPTASDLNVHDTLDERHACNAFLGKSVEEAEELFRENALFYQEDLMWMGPVAFRFYVESIIRYLESNMATDDADAISCFARVLEFRLEDDPTQFVPIAGRIASICNYITEHTERFSLSEETYGDIRARFRTLRNTFQRLLSPGKPALHRDT